MEQRFGNDYVCSVGTYTTLQLKAAIKDLCRGEADFAEVNIITSILEDKEESVEDLFKTCCKEPRLRKFINSHPDIFNDIFLILGQPKSKSIHACAMIVFPKEKTMFEWCPVRKQQGMIVSEWEGVELDSAGFLKEDILGIKQLDKFTYILNLIKKNYGEEIDIRNLNLKDKKVFNFFKKGWNSDVFQLGTDGLQNYCKQMQPDTFEDIIASLALYRPGTMENNFHNEYVLRKQGLKEVNYPKGAKEILKNTYGLLVYQEQVMKLCQELAGFDLQTADDIRKAIGKKNMDKMKQYRDLFVNGYIDIHEVKKEVAEELWEQIEKFASYSFNKCIAGSEKFFVKDRRGTYYPTIEEMYKIKNDLLYAKENGKVELRNNYLKNGYGITYSLNNENKRLIKNKIKDIEFSGLRDIYEIFLDGGASIKVTDNHKHPTNNGMKRTDELIVGVDKMYVNVGYEKGEKVFFTILRRVIKVVHKGMENTYNVEMEDPYHTFVTDKGIVTCNSHSACYAMNSYICQWLKVHYPIEFWSVAFSYAQDKHIPRFVSEIYQSGGIKLIPVDINKSSDTIVCDGDSLYWTLTSVKQAGEKAIQYIKEDKEKFGEYFSFEEFLSRCNIKGSPVNKSVVENLVLCGAFDKVENLKKPNERYNLIEFYRKEKKVKIDEEKDLFFLNKHKSGLDWWYMLQQKRLSGFASFDYKNLCENYIMKHIDEDYHGFMPYEKFTDVENYSTIERGMTGGYVLDLDIRDGKEGAYATLTLEQNYQFFRVKIFSDLLNDNLELIQKSLGNIMLLNGNVQYNRYTESNIFQAVDDTIFVLLT